MRFDSHHLARVLMLMAAMLLVARTNLPASPRPNILWIVSDIINDL